MDAATALLIVSGAAVVWLLIHTRSIALTAHRKEVERNILNRQLQQSRELYNAQQAHQEALSALAFDAILFVDRERRILSINPQGRQIFKAGPDAIGKTVMTVTRHHELDALVGTLLAGEEAPETQIVIDGRVFRVRGALSRAPHEDAVILILQDVTELLRLSRARRDMVANLSHDLRTPISSIRLLVEGLMLNVGKNPERDMRNLGKIASMVDNLQHMTQELMDLAMIESGQAIMRMVSVDVLEIVQNALRVMESQIEQKHIDVINTVPTGLTVLADPDQIKRVITNLVHNAIKFTPTEGQIQFTARHNGQTVTVCLKDTGPGIPPHERERIFERFYQVDSARTTTGERAGGTGLGLAIAKHIIEAHGGKIWAEAGIPGGACICFTLPLDRVSAEPQSLRPQEVEPDR